MLKRQLTCSNEFRIDSPVSKLTSASLARLALLIAPIALGGAFFDAAAQPLPQRAPFTIAPVIEGLVECIGVKQHEEYKQFFDPGSRCVKHDFDAAAALADVLDRLEPGGAAGQVQLGYTATIPLLGLYQKIDGAFVLDAIKIEDYMDLITRMQRPVVIYLVADHFDSRGPLPEALAGDKANMLQLADGSVPASNYFGNKVLPFTLLTNPNLEVNRYRFEAANYVLKRIAALPPDVRQRIIAITMAGEVHQMFRDFENGMGDFREPQVTDYHPSSVALFRSWLERRYGRLDTFNETNGFAYASFDDVPAPSKDIRRDQLQSFGEHYDGFAHGELPVAGWLWDPQRRVDRLELVVDGESAGDVPRGFNRLDVYRAVDEITDPNVGFRLNLRFDAMAPGRHVGQVLAHAAGQRLLLGAFEFNVIGRDQAPLPDAAAPRLQALEPLSALAGVRGWLDLPKSSQDLYFNPLARDWNAFRAEQVLHFIEHFNAMALAAGIEQDKLYSHQIVPQVNSSWNAKLFSVDRSLKFGLPWRSGLNMYGGAADSDWIRAFIGERHLVGYGVPEFNPQQWKRPGVHREAMLSHYRGGARFISPYYLSITSGAELTGRATLNRLEIRPDNPVEGSAAFYQAIGELARQ